MKVKVK